jgi:hypothetical protein
VFENRLRYFSVEGRLIPTLEEANLEEIKQAEIAIQRAEIEQRKAEVERQKAEVERQKAESESKRADEAENKAAILAQKLRELGVEPDSL